MGMLWREIVGGTLVLDHPTQSSTFVMSLSYAHRRDWWVSGRLQPVKAFGPYPTLEAAKQAVEMLQEQGLLY